MMALSARMITMKSKILLILMAITIVALPLSAQVDTTRVLFIGNSHTFYNDMPTIFADLSESGGHFVIKDSSTPGGYTLMQHTTNQTTLDKIAEGTWDYVLLQENSQYPVIEYLRYNSMYPASRFLDSLITSYGERTVFFLSWGWQNGGHFEIDGHESPVFEDYFEMQDTMNSAYTEIATELSAILAPAGMAWAVAATWDPEINLWQPDTYHPTVKGSYLAACVFFRTFFHESPVGIEYTAGLTHDEALFLQQAADEVQTGIDEPSPEVASSFELLQNYPNPFNSRTVIKYTLNQPSHVTVKIYDILGREVSTLADCHQEVGSHAISWNGFDNNYQPVSSGVYFYKLQANNSTQCRKLIYLR